MVNMILEILGEIADGARTGICFAAYSLGFLAVLSATAISVVIAFTAISNLF